MLPRVCRDAFWKFARSIGSRRSWSLRRETMPCREAGCWLVVAGTTSAKEFTHLARPPVRLVAFVIRPQTCLVVCVLSRKSPRKSLVLLHAVAARAVTLCGSVMALASAKAQLPAFIASVEKRDTATATQQLAALKVRQLLGAHAAVCVRTAFPRSGCTCALGKRTRGRCCLRLVWTPHGLCRVVHRSPST